MEKILLIKVEFIDSYLDNILLMPLLLHGLLHERKWLWKTSNTYKLPLLDQIIATLIVIVISELAFPRLSNSFVYDEFDVICYIAGTITYNVTLANN